MISLKIFNVPTAIEVAMADIRILLDALSGVVGLLGAGLLLTAYARRRPFGGGNG